MEALAPSPTPNALPIGQVWGKLEELTGGLLLALQKAIGPEGLADDLLAWAARTAQLRSDVQAAPRLRPWLRAWTAADATIENLVVALRGFVEAAGEKTPLQAQMAAREAQRALDEAANPISEEGEELEMAQAIAEAASTEEALELLGQQVFKRAHARDFLALDRDGFRHFRRITQSTDEPPAGTGLGLSLLVGEVEGSMNMVRFWRVAQEAYVILLSDHQRLEALVTTDEWRKDFKTALLRSYDANVGLMGTVASARHARHEVDALLTAAHGVIEGSAKLLMAGLLFGRAGGDYKTARALDASVLIKHLVDLGLADLLEGIDHTIRVAEAHDEFHLDRDDVVFTGRTAQYQRLSAAELVDRVLATQETTSALVAATYCACLSVGGTIPNVDLAVDLGLDQQSVLTLFVALNGMTNAEVLLEPPLLTITGDLELSAGSMPVVGALLPFIPPEVERVALEARSGQDRHRLPGLCSF
jgi:hypothetical protein